MKIHNKIFKIYDKVYHASILFIIGDYEFHAREIMKRFKIDVGEQVNAGGESYSIDIKQTGRAEYWVIWMPSWNWFIEDHGILTHETLHTAFRIFGQVGIKLDLENQEPITYYHEYLYEQCLELLSKERNKR